MIGKETIKQLIKEKTAEMMPLAGMMNKPVRELAANFSNSIVEKGVPIFVEEQVSSFSVSRLEDMVVSITKKELSKITYLGALLGGIIGLFQGFVTVLIG